MKLCYSQDNVSLAVATWPAGSPNCGDFSINPEALQALLEGVVTFLTGYCFAILGVLGCLAGIWLCCLVAEAVAKIREVLRGQEQAGEQMARSAAFAASAHAAASVAATNAAVAADQYARHLEAQPNVLPIFVTLPEQFRPESPVFVDDLPPPYPNWPFQQDEEENWDTEEEDDPGYPDTLYQGEVGSDWEMAPELQADWGDTTVIIDVQPSSDQPDWYERRP